MSQQSASERSVVKLFDAYIRQGIDAENAIFLVRASLGVAKQDVEGALRRAGKLVSASLPLA